MSTILNMPTGGVAMTPQLSKRALAELKKGAMVKLWVLCPPFKIEDNGATKSESESMLFSLHKALMKHFSPKWKRELAGDENANRIHMPFQKEPVKLIAGWMMAGGGDELGTATDPYPKKSVNNLEILKRLAVYLELEQLSERITKDIKAIHPILPAVPAAKFMPKTGTAPINTTVRTERRCYFCDKPGHIQRNCPKRNAVFMTKSNAEIFALDGTRRTVESTIPQKEKLKPVSGQIEAIDKAGRTYVLP